MTIDVTMICMEPGSPPSHRADGTGRSKTRPVDLDGILLIMKLFRSDAAKQSMKALELLYCENLDAEGV